MMALMNAAVPPHLRSFVVEQDYERYTAIDQAVWRFVLLQLQSRLSDNAHPLYREGLESAGISAERIPRLDEVNERLSRWGWGAVCVDGFIPPRAFQEFQACGILPIAAEIRTRQHLPYTPAPDIIHEAAGHAPILPEPVFAAYLKRMGDLGAQAFTFPEEASVYQAIHRLSRLKEDPSVTPGVLAAAEQSLVVAIDRAPEPSEATLLSRLYWWTAEYGLLDAHARGASAPPYHIYGAGLLSSLGESHTCLGPDVRKIAIDAGCIKVPYDITRSQPQLFVSPSFEHLHDVLDDVSRLLAVSVGGSLALRRAIRSAEILSVQFSSGLWTTAARLVAAGPDLEAPAWLQFAGPLLHSWRHECAWDDTGEAPEGTHWIPLGLLSNGARPETLSDTDWGAMRDPTSGRHFISFASGAHLEGRYVRHMRDADGRLREIEFADARLSLPGGATLRLPRYLWTPAGEINTVRAGAVDSRYFPAVAAVGASVPRPRTPSESEQRLLRLYEQGEDTYRHQPMEIRKTFSDVHGQLIRDYPDEWLLRWNLLESLIHAGVDGGMSRDLAEELRNLEVHWEYRQPIASGLRYLDR